MTFAICSLVAIQVSADVPRFDVIEFSNGSESLYIRTWSSGTLKNHDLCYYKWNGEYIDEVEHAIEKLFQQDSIEVFDELVKIDLYKFDKRYGGCQDSVLYILNGLQKRPVDNLKNSYSIVDAFNANTGGFCYTEELTNNDNIWLNDYPMEALFNLTDYELCNMVLYAIKNNVSKERKNKLRIELDSFLKVHDRKSYQKRLSELYKENIIMVGFCSC